MINNLPTDYRRRIYASYSSARDRPLAPSRLDELTPRLPYLQSIIRQHFPKDRGAVILDLGCGHGALLYALQQSGYHHALGVDGSPEQVAAAQHLGIQGVSEGDVMQVLRGTRDASQDVVVAFDLIEHFTKPELIVLIDEVHRVLKPGGRWIIHVPNGESPFGSRIFFGDFTHELSFTRQSLAQVLLSSGFTQISCFEDRPVPHGFKSLGRSVLWTVIRASLLSYLTIETGLFDRKAIFSQNLLAVAVRGV